MKIFGFAGFSGAGKTTLLEGIIPCLVKRGLCVSLIKHAHHDFDIDQPGKDSWRHRNAGCGEVMVASRNRIALMTELWDAPEPPLTELLVRLAPCDLVLVEGYKHATIPKIEVRRTARIAPTLHDFDPWIVAVASDRPVNTPLPTFGLDDHAAIAAFICRYLGLRRRKARPSAATPQKLQHRDTHCTHRIVTVPVDL